MTSAAQTPEKLEISRQDLYEQVWSTPANKLADKFGVSGSYLARVCDALKVPRPPVGYWQKLAVGKAKPRPDLPVALPGDQVTWSKDKPLATSSKRLAQPRPIKAVTPAAKPEPASPHPLLQGVDGHFRKTRKLDEGEFLKPYKQLLPDIVTSEACLVRALGLANDIYNALERRGHRVCFAPPDHKMRRPNIEERESPGKDAKAWSVFDGPNLVPISPYDHLSGQHPHWTCADGDDRAGYASSDWQQILEGRQQGGSVRQGLATGQFLDD